MKFDAALIIGVVLLSLILHLSLLNMQGSLAMAQKKNNQHNECKGNSTGCTNVGSNDITISTNSPDNKHKGDNIMVGNSNNRNSQTDTPLLLPFP